MSGLFLWLSTWRAYDVANSLAAVFVGASLYARQHEELSLYVDATAVATNTTKPTIYQAMADAWSADSGELAAAGFEFWLFVFGMGSSPVAWLVTSALSKVTSRGAVSPDSARVRVAVGLTDAEGTNSPLSLIHI